MQLPLSSPTIALQRLAQLDPKDYAQTRHALDGAVSGLSPYLTHGYLSPVDVARALYQRHRIGVQHKFIYQLGWREYFQHLHEHLGVAGLAQSRHPGLLPDEAYGLEMPEDVRQACTRVPVIDGAVRMLYETGYLHHQARLWLASYLVHLRKVHWRVGADWLYGHLLDGDVASNYLNWQGVAGTFGERPPYLFNAESIESLAPASWFSRGTSIDVSSEMIEIFARNPATVAQAEPGQHAWVEPSLTDHPPADWALDEPQAGVLAGRDVWLVHPWHLADPPADLPSDCVRVAVCWHEAQQAHPWGPLRWQFVVERMRAITDHVWWSDAAYLRAVLAQARSVQATAHPRLPAWADVPWRLRPSPRLFRPVETLCEAFPNWWYAVNKGVRNMQQLVAPLVPRP